MRTQKATSHHHSHKPVSKELVFKIKISNLILFLGTAIVVSALLYMLFHLSGSDKIITLWFPIIVSGVLLVFLSQMIYPSFKNVFKNQLKFRRR